MMKGTNYEAPNHANSSNFSPMISSPLSPAILLSTMGSYTSASDFYTMEVKKKLHNYAKRPVKEINISQSSCF
jgi:hypothetical protein